MYLEKEAPNILWPQFFLGRTDSDSEFSYQFISTWSSLTQSQLFK